MGTGWNRKRLEKHCRRHLAPVQYLLENKYSRCRNATTQEEFETPTWEHSLGGAHPTNPLCARITLEEDWSRGRLRCAAALFPHLLRPVSVDGGSREAVAAEPFFEGIGASFGLHKDKRQPSLRGTKHRRRAHNEGDMAMVFLVARPT